MECFSLATPPYRNPREWYPRIFVPREDSDLPQNDSSPPPYPGTSQLSEHVPHQRDGSHEEDALPPLYPADEFPLQTSDQPEYDTLQSAPTYHASREEDSPLTSTGDSRGETVTLHVAAPQPLYPTETQEYSPESPPQRQEENGTLSSGTPSQVAETEVQYGPLGDHLQEQSATPPPPPYPAEIEVVEYPPLGDQLREQSDALQSDTPPPPYPEGDPPLPVGGQHQEGSDTLLQGVPSHLAEVQLQEEQTGYQPQLSLSIPEPPRYQACVPPQGTNLN